MKVGQGVFGAVSGDEAGNRRRERMRVLLAARLVTTFNDRPVKIRDLSSEGAMIEGDGVPSEGTDVILQRGPIEVFATVVWSDGRQCGLEFEDALVEEDFLTLLNPPLPTGPAIEPPTRRYSPLRSEPMSHQDWAAARDWFHPTGRGRVGD
jgi:hypothetical protein